MNVQNYFCPVCGQDFNESDDVVFCPECGTPHHRKCWQEIGRCVNTHMHGTGEPVDHTFKRENIPVEPIFEEKANQSQNPSAENNAPFTVFNEPYDNSGASTVYIDGNPSYLYEIAVEKNQQYYLPRFMLMDKTKKGSSWNFVAFIFPLAWVIYRKMYKIAALIFAVYIAVFSVSAYYVYTNEAVINSFIECYEEDPEFYQDISLAVSGEDATLTVKQQAFIEAVNSITVPPFAQWIVFGLTYGVKFFMSVQGNKLYFKKLTKSINKGSDSGLTGDTLKNYVFKKNGVLPLFVAILVGIIEWGI